ncbi:MAG: SCO family protein [Maricaulaceae bacterium]
MQLKPLCFMFALMLGLSSCSPNEPVARSGKNIVVSGTAEIGGPFTLLNQDGDIVTEQSLLGRPTLTYFGFTYCPDICPTALQSIGTAMATVDPKGDYFQTVLFSVDPERDTPELLKQYVSAPIFPKGLQGFTGTVEQVTAAKAAYKIYAVKVEQDDASDYLVDHVSLIYLFDKDGEFVDVFTHGTSVRDLMNRLDDYKTKNPL